MKSKEVLEGIVKSEQSPNHSRKGIHIVTELTACIQAFLTAGDPHPVDELRELTRRVKAISRTFPSFLPLMFHLHLPRIQC